MPEFAEGTHQHLARIRAQWNDSRIDELEGLAAEARRGARAAETDTLRAAFLHLSGALTAKLFDSTGRLAQLVDSVKMMRQALALQALDTVGEASCRKNLAVALVRIGEQQSDIVLLREALDILKQFEPFNLEEARLANAAAVARNWIGSIAGDSQMVERAVLDLRRLLKVGDLPRPILAQTAQNLAMLLLENARQNRSARVYLQLLETLDADTFLDNSVRLQVRGSARLELAQIAKEPELLDLAKADFDRIASNTVLPPARRSAALHSIAQTFFAQAKSDGNTPEGYQTAIDYLEQALALLPQESGTDARRSRIRADLAAYTLAHAWSGGGRAMVGLACNRYREALAEISIDRAPFLHARVALGLFELHFQMRQWRQASATADRIMNALRRIESDIELSAGVHDHGPRIRADLSDKHARCLIELGGLREASNVLELNRGRRIALAYTRSRNPDDAFAEIGTLRHKVEEAIRTGDDTACRRRWEDYLTARRRAGLDLLNVDTTNSEGIPREAILLQLARTQFGATALLRLATLEVRLLPLPTRLIEELDRLTANDGGLTAAYSRFLEGDDLDFAAAVATACRALGDHLFTPLMDFLEQQNLGKVQTVYLSPPGAWAALPFTSADITSSGFVESRFRLSVAPSLISIRDASPRKGTVICVADPAGQREDASDLPYARMEPDRIAQTIPHVEIFRGDDASPAKVIDALRRAEVLHIACHATYGGHNETGLHLAGGSFLSLRRLAASGFERVSTRLVFLSACEAGMSGRTLDANEFVGLPGTLLELGVATVIAPLWAVYDDAALVLADCFYRNFLGRNGTMRISPAEALSEAKSFLRTATLQHLIESGYIDKADAAGLQPVRLRRMQCTSREQAGKTFVRDSERPFSSPENWAGWTLFGRTS